MSDELKDPVLDAYSSPDPNVLFSDSLLRELDHSKCSCHAKHGLSYLNPGSKDGRRLVARPLEATDHAKGYLSLLSQLTKVGDYSAEVFEAQFARMKRMQGCHYVVVVEDSGVPGSENGTKGRVVASATLLVECKFIRGASRRGRIEDVVVDSDYRGMHLGKLLLECLNLLAQVLGCYKVTLDCKEPMLPYYSDLGYENEGQYFLTQRFSD